MNVAPLFELATGWRAEAALYRRRGQEPLAQLAESFASELEARVQEWAVELLDIRQAAVESGYSEDHLRQLVREGRIPDARPQGSEGRIHIQRRDLPRKAPADGPRLGAVEALAEKVLAARR